MLEISYTDKGEERIFQVVDINGSSPAIKSILYEGLSEKNQSLLLKETRAALQFSTKDYPKLRKLKVSFRYISGEKGPTKVYDIPLKQKEPEVVKEIPAPKEMTLKPEVTKKEVKEIKKKVVQKKKVVKKAPPSFKYFPYAFSGMDAFFATQLRNDAKSTTISSPFLGGGALIQHRKYPKNYLDVRAYYNKVLKTDTRQLNQPDKINLAAELKLYQQNKWKTDINYYFKYVRHSYLESADPEEINFGMQNVYLLGFGFSPALTQDFWIFEDNLFYLYYEVSSDGDSLAPVVEFESVFKSFQFYEHKFTPFLEMGMKSLSGSAYDQIIYTLFVGSYF